MPPSDKRNYKGAVEVAPVAPVAPEKEDASDRQEELERELERLKLENENLKKAFRPKFEVTWKISDKGAISVYGLGRFPTTLYAQQWQKLLEKADDILEFIDDYKDKLSWRA